MRNRIIISHKPYFTEWTNERNNFFHEPTTRIYLLTHFIGQEQEKKIIYQHLFKVLKITKKKKGLHKNNQLPFKIDSSSNVLLIINFLILQSLPHQFRGPVFWQTKPCPKQLNNQSSGSAISSLVRGLSIFWGDWVLDGDNTLKAEHFFRCFFFNYLGGLTFHFLHFILRDFQIFF